MLYRYYYMFSGRWLMMLLPRRACFFQISEIICFHTEMGFFNQEYQKDLQIKQFPTVFSLCFCRVLEPCTLLKGVLKLPDLAPETEHP